MQNLVWIGAVVSLAGLAGLVWCIFQVTKAKRRTSDDAELKAVVQRVMPLNLGALFLSVLGLMMVVVGIFLG
ncbi:hypothetical protein [Pseudaestuariivita atlantica]|uniref:Uncharacterized protein n=1 Tax=Pseudaestuariivita atlantica TaxID=1317121 RepID=A0A0L1JTC5_9RHOB|nr:hypothetical protein [Pseudaestuariivita atlantica]KNG95011.1 hypothetical protein ATO11_06530 [Pseudaestuariivita atlantica]